MKNRIVKLIIPFAFIMAILCINNKVQAASLEKDNVDLYVIDDAAKTTYNIDVPKELPKTYQIKVIGTTEKPTYSVIEGEDNVTVSDTGLIEPVTENWTYPDGSVRAEYNIGSAKIEVKLSNQTLQLTVNVNSYPEYYAENIAKKWVAENITSDMTNYEKLYKIVQHIAEDYDYSARFSGWISMFLTGGGDCWASTSAIIELCELVNIPAKSRYAVIDPGAGSGHRNAVALVDGEVYICDAGYSGSKPRYFDIYKHEPAYTYEIKSDDTIRIIQYDGFDENITIPSNIGERTVTTIGTSAFANSVTKPKSITLPNTITTIEDTAFWNCEDLSINIPSSVTTIGGAPFLLCKNIKLDISQNDNFVIDNGVLYTKDKTKVIEVLETCNSKQLILPSTVKTIGKYAMYYNEVVEQISLPANLESIEDRAFYSSKLTSITIPGSVRNIEQGAFDGAYSLKTAIIENGVTALPQGMFASDFSLKVVEIPESVKSIGEDAFKGTNSSLKIYGVKGSYAQKYANGNNITFVEGIVNEIVPEMITIENKNNIVYTGKLIKPKITVFIGSKKLTEGVDYTITYDSKSINAGSYELTVNGIGSYKGEAKVSYEIKRLETKFDFTCSDTFEGTPLKPVVTENNTPYTPSFMYRKVGNDYYTNIVPKEIGEYIVAGTIYGNNYTYKRVEKRVKITKSDLPFTDVGLEDWFYNAVKYTYKNKMISGYNATTFAPNDKLTRGMIVTILYRMEGSPSNDGKSKFVDVDSEKYYAKAVK